MTAKVRSPFEVTFSVWRAMFLREALDRLFDMRGAWLWLLLEPAMWIGVHVVLYSAIHVPVVGGMRISYWVAEGFIAFLLWRRTSTQVTYAIDCNRAYFAYRQVKPFDAAMMRAVLEAALMVPIAVIILTFLAASGYNLLPGLSSPALFPNDPIMVVLGLTGLWLFGVGYGLVASALMVFVPEMEHIYKMLYLPLILISGAGIHVASIPVPYRDMFLLNPIVHGIEIVRQGFLPYYHTASEVSLAYLYEFALGSILLGMVLYRRFSKKLVMK